MKLQSKTLTVLLLVAVLTAGCAAKPSDSPPAEESPVPDVVQTEESHQEETVLMEQTEETASPETTLTAIPPETTAPTATAEPALIEQTPAPTSTPALTTAGDIPFSHSEFQFDWWGIDSTDDAYWNTVTNINNIRTQAGLPTLTADSTLSDIASNRCEQIISSGDFSHSGQSTPGEILGQNYNSSGTVCGAWQNSPDHYAQITGAYSRMGVGCLYERGGGTVWCVVFQ